MIKVFAILKTFSTSPYEIHTHVHINKDGVDFELAHEEVKELLAVLEGKRKIAQTPPKEGEYYSEYVYLYNGDTTSKP